MGPGYWGDAGYRQPLLVLGYKIPPNPDPPATGRSAKSPPPPIVPFYTQLPRYPTRVKINLPIHNPTGVTRLARTSFPLLVHHSRVDVSSPRIPLFNTLLEAAPGVPLF